MAQSPPDPPVWSAPIRSPAIAVATPGRGHPGHPWWQMDNQHTMGWPGMNGYPKKKGINQYINNPFLDSQPF